MTNPPIVYWEQKYICICSVYTLSRRAHFHCTLIQSDSLHCFTPCGTGGCCLYTGVCGLYTGVCVVCIRACALSVYWCVFLYTGVCCLYTCVCSLYTSVCSVYTGMCCLYTSVCVLFFIRVCVCVCVRYCCTFPSRLRYAITLQNQKSSPLSSPESLKLMGLISTLPRQHLKNLQLLEEGITKVISHDNF